LAYFRDQNQKATPLTKLNLKLNATDGDHILLHKPQKVNEKKLGYITM